MSRFRTRVRGKVQGNPAPKGKVDISDIVKAIRKEFGDNSIITASEKRQPRRIPTGIFQLDLATLGGVMVNCINEFKGAKHSGKTTGSFKVIASAQKMYPDRAVAFVDMEHAFDPVWAEKNGVDVDALILVQPLSGEEAVDQIQGLMAHAGICLVVLDSIATLVPMKEVEAATEDAHVGIHAKLVTRLVRKVLHSISSAAKEGREVTFLCTNQQRAGIGKWAPNGQEALSDPGGKALGHYTVLEVVFKNKEGLKKDEEGFEMLDVNEHAFKIEKNKWNAGIRKGDFLMRRSPHPDYALNECDVDDAEGMLGFAKKMGLYTGGGRAWTLELPDFEETRGGMADWCEYLYDNREIYVQLRSHLIALHAVKLGMPQYLVDSIYEQEL